MTEQSEQKTEGYHKTLVELPNWQGIDQAYPDYIKQRLERSEGYAIYKRLQRIAERSYPRSIKVYGGGDITNVIDDVRENRLPDYLEDVFNAT